MIQKFDKSGLFLTQWGGVGSANGKFNTPLGIAADKMGNIYVADSKNNRVQIFDTFGTHIRSIVNGFNVPSGIAADDFGNIYVADTGNHRIQKFNAQGTYLKFWGGQGTGDGKFNTPWGVAVDGAGNVYVADSKNNRIQKFSAEGAYLAKWGIKGVLDGQFNEPKGVFLDGSGNLYITDTLNHRIQRLLAQPIDGGGLNFNLLSQAITPQLAVFNHELFAVWAERIDGHTHIRAKKYNGVFWSDAQVGDINMDKGKNAYNPVLAEFKGDLYLAWYEETGGNNSFQVFVKKYDSLSNSWTEGENISYSMNKAFNVKLAVWNNELFALWVEKNGTANQVRSKKYNGTLWQAVDGGTLNYNENSKASLPSLAVSDNKVYAAWSEAGKIVVKGYNGMSWEEIDGECLNYDPYNDADMPVLLPGTENLYIIWAEKDEEANYQVRSKLYNGTGWVINDAGSLNADKNQSAFMLSGTIFEDNIYAAWTEEGKAIIKSKPAGSGSWLEQESLDYAKGAAFAEYGGKLYISWQENSGAEGLIRMRIFAR